jgi:hypothetical protein
MLLPAVREAMAPIYALDMFLQMAELVKIQITVTLASSWREFCDETPSPPGTWTYDQTARYVAPMLTILATGLQALMFRLGRYRYLGPGQELLDPSFFEPQLGRTMINELKELHEFTIRPGEEGISWWQLMPYEQLQDTIVGPLKTFLGALEEAERQLRKLLTQDIHDLDVGSSEVEPCSPPDVPMPAEVEPGSPSDVAMPDLTEEAPTRRHPLNIADEDIEAYMRERNEQKSRMDSVTANQQLLNELNRILAESESQIYDNDLTTTGWFT